MVDNSVGLLNRNHLANSFFYLDYRDPMSGFAFDATHFCGPTYPEYASDIATAATEPSHMLSDPEMLLQTRLLVASHLAAYLRGQLVHQKGYTSSVGISTSKLLSKLVGSVHKPNSQTTLLAPYVACPAQNRESNVITFLDAHEIRKVPGIGFKIAHKLRAHLLGMDLDSDINHQDSSNSPAASNEITVRDLRTSPGMGSMLLDKILSGPGAPKGIGARIFALLHGVDDSAVMEVRNIPTQISIEDSFGRLDTMENVKKALVSLATNLIQRMRMDLTESSTKDAYNETRWLAHPRTIRLSTRARTAEGDSRFHHFNRTSRSAPLPQFVFGLEENPEALAERLVQERLVDIFRKLHPERLGWNLSLLNIGVTNMVESAGESKSSSGRDIGKMFRTQEPLSKDDGKIPGSRTPSSPPSGGLVAPELTSTSVQQSSSTVSAWEESDEDELMPSETCAVCGAAIPYFAWAAHSRYHLVPES